MCIKKLFLIILLLSYSCGISEGGSVGQVFQGLKEDYGTVQALSPSSVRVKWTKPKGYASFKIYAGSETEELSLRGTTRLSSFTINGLDVNTNYRFAVEGFKDTNGASDGKNNIKNFKTWAEFEGIDTVNPISSSALQISWRFENKESMSYEVYISSGDLAPDLQKAPYTTIQDTQLNISGLTPSTDYNFIIRAIYPSGDKDSNVKMLSGRTDSSIDPMPVVIFDSASLGRRPSFKVLSMSSGIEVYILHNSYTNIEGETFEIGDLTVAGPITQAGVNQVYNTYTGFLPGVHKVRIRVKSGQEDLIKPELIEFKVRGLLEEDWKIASTDYAQPQRMGSGSYLSNGTATSVYAWLGWPYYYRILSWGKVLASGDFNGDYIDDLAVAIPYATKEKENQYFVYAKGFVVIFYGVDGQGLKTDVEPSLTPLNATDPLIIDASYENDKDYTFRQGYFGYAMDAGLYTLKKNGSSRIRTGDINGDGTSDLIIGAPTTTSYQGANGYSYYSGAVFIYYGSYGTGLNNNIDFLLEQNNSCSGGVCQPLVIRSPGFNRTDSNINDYHFFGASVAHIGDINADGYGDIAVSAPQMHNSATAAGEVFVFYGSENGLVVKDSIDTDKLNYVRITKKGVFSSSCQNGDAPCVDYSYVTTNPDKASTGESPQNYEVFGASISGGLNLMDDAKPELVISAPYFGGSSEASPFSGYSASSGHGKIYVFYGHEVGTSGIGKGFTNFKTITVPDSANLSDTGFSNTTPQAWGRNNLGKSIALIPDVNGDGYDELLSSVGYNPNINAGTKKEGVIVYHGKFDGVWGDVDGSDEGVNCIDVFSSAYQKYCYNRQACTGSGVDVRCCPQYIDLDACSSSGLQDEDSSFWDSIDPVVNISGGDFNDDGYGDFILGRPFTDSISGITPFASNSGSACLFYSSGSNKQGISQMNYTFYESAGNMPSLYYGSSVGVGDFTGDGKDDIAIGMPSADVSGIDFNGKIAIYNSEEGYSSPKISATKYLSGYYTDELTSYEQVPLHAGDINGDGYGDVVVRIRYYYNGARYYGFVIIHGSPTGLVMDKEAVTQPYESSDPQIVVPFRDLGFTSSANMCYNIIPIGDVNNDGHDDLYCNDDSHHYGLVFYGVHSGGVDITTPIETYDQRSDYSTVPQLFYKYNSGNGRGQHYYQGFYYYGGGLDYQKGLGDFNNNGYGDVAFSNPYYGTYVNLYYEMFGNVWVAYGSKKGLQDPSGTGAISTPYKELTDYTSPGAYCYTDHVVFRSNEENEDPERVCNTTTNVCKIQQLAGYDTKISAGVCNTTGVLLNPEGFEITDGRHQQFGRSLTTINYNDDAYTDLLVGAPYVYENIGGALRSNVGRVYKYKGTAGGLIYDGYISFSDAFEAESSINYSTSSFGASNYLGWVINNAGDVNGDGAEDVLINSYGAKSTWGLSYLVYGSKTNKNLQIGAGTFADKYVLNDNNSCSGDTCKILIFYPPMGSNAHCNRVIGVGDVNSIDAPHYEDVLVNCYNSSVHNGTASNGNWGTGESFLYTGSPNGLVVKGLNNQPGFSNKPVCIGGLCTPYNFYPKNLPIPKTYKQYGTMFSQPSSILLSDFNGDGFKDFIVPLNINSKYNGNSMVGGFFIFY